MSDRSTVPCRVDFRTIPAQSLTEYTGRLESLWVTGCTILTTAQPDLDVTLELRIYLPDGEWPLHVDSAQITWGHWGSFIVEFVNLPAHDHARLTTYLATQQTLVKA